MKNKKIAYLLLPLVIFIWGAIAYKIIRNYLGNNSPEILFNQNENIIQSKNKIDTFSLLLNYPDPFLKNQVASNYQPSNNNPQKTTTNKTTTANNKKENNPVKWPTILYCGNIKNKNNNKICSIIKINGTENIMYVGEVCNEVRLVKVFKDSVIVNYKNQNKTIIK